MFSLRNIGGAIALLALVSFTLSGPLFAKKKDKKESGEAIMIEAEEGEIKGGKVQTDHAGFTGTGFVNFDEKSEVSIAFKTEAKKKGDYTLAFRYALGSKGPRVLKVVVNGNTAVESLEFPPAGWKTYQEVSCDVSLDKGENSIEVDCIKKVGPNLDSLKLTPK